MLGACQANPSPRCKYTRYQLNDVKWASGLTYAWGSLWAVADRKQHIIYKLSLDGKLPKKIKLKLEPDSALFKKYKIKLNKKRGWDLEGITADETHNIFYILSEDQRMVLKTTRDAKIIDMFPIEGENSKLNQGLEGIAYSDKTGLLYIAEEGPLLSPKNIYTYATNGKKTGTFQLKQNYRITSLCYQNGRLLALSSAYPLPLRHQILELSESEFSNDFQYNLFMDLGKAFGFAYNYEGMASDGKGNIYLVDDASDDQSSRLIKISFIK